MLSMAFVVVVLYGFAYCPIASAAASTEPRRLDYTGCCTHVIVQAWAEADVFDLNTPNNNKAVAEVKLALTKLTNTTDMYFAGDSDFTPEENFRYTSTHAWTCLYGYRTDMLLESACISRFEFLSDDFANVAEQHVDTNSTVNACPLARTQQRGPVVIVCEDQLMTLEYAGFMLSGQMRCLLQLINIVQLLVIIPISAGYAQGALMTTAVLWTVSAVLVVAYVALGASILRSTISLAIQLFLTCLVMSVWMLARRRRRAYLNVVEAGLPDLLADGSIRLLSIDWLLKQSDNYVLSRCQDLPAEAFVECRVAVLMLSAGKRIAVMSYGWLTALHPDPDSFHLRALVSFLRRQRGKHHLQALFLDFASLPQKDSAGVRSTEDERKFKAALKVMSSLYATPQTTVLQHSALPSCPPEHYNTRPYFASDGRPGRGWCYSEHHTALTLVARGHLINLVSGPVRSTSRDRISPIQMRDALLDETQIQFTGRGDAETVAKMYAVFHRRVTDYEISSDLLFMSGRRVFFSGRIRAFTFIAFVIFYFTAMTALWVFYLFDEHNGGALVLVVGPPIGLALWYVYTKRKLSYYGVDRRLVHPGAAPGAEPDPEAYGAGTEPEAAPGPAAEPELLS